MLKTFPLIALLVLPMTRIFAQDQPYCITEQRHEALLASDPAYRQRVELENQWTIERTRQLLAGAEMGSSTFTIPIVVHVIYPPGTPFGTGNNLSDGQIEDGVTLLNQVFANTGPSQSPDGVNTGISFCLARRDPQGNPTNGILRHASDLVNDTICSGKPSTATEREADIKSLSRWDCERYLNIWLVTDLYYQHTSDCGVAGFAYYPGASCTTDGIIMEGRHWISPVNISVAAHEVGHHLNLRHTFSAGCANDYCESEGDYVCDTPPDKSTTMADCDANSCQTDSPDLPDDVRNYMDYSWCRPKHFTPGQAARMAACLQGSRAELVSGAMCEPLTENDAAILSISLSKLNCGDQACPSLRVKNKGKKPISSMKIMFRANGIGAGAELDWTGDLLPGAIENIALPCLWVLVGNNYFEATVLSVNGSNDDFTSDNKIELDNIEFFPKPKLSLASVESAICGEGGRLRVEVESGTGPFFYHLGNSTQAEQSFNDLVPGQFWANVTDANGCRDSLQLVVPDTCPPCLGGIINHYAAVEDICEQSILTVGSTLGFEPGMKVLIYQAQGATIDTSSTPDFGKILDLGGAGLWEINRIGAIGSSSIQLQMRLERPFDLSGGVQIVSIPNLGSRDVCNLKAKPWDGQTGGILIFEGSKINLIGNVDVSNAGFRGGQLQCCVDTTHCGTKDWYAPLLSGKGGMKGEGISRQLADNQRACRGRYANGGGGGNDHNAGGGGGANAGSGGLGGKETVVGCNFNISVETSGQGGGGFVYSPAENRLFFGGGGGCGDAETYSQNFDVKPGGNGGGLLFIMADSLLSSGGLLRANGENVDGVAEGLNGQGGGGGGGVIFLDVKYHNPLYAEVNGGKGGSVLVSNWDPKHGPGGGGGGGILLSTDDLQGINSSYNGGQPGLTDGATTHGALPGLPGLILPNQPLAKSTQPVSVFLIEKTTLERTPCTDRYKVVFAPNNTAQPLEISLNGGNWQNATTFSDLPPGQALFSFRQSCFQKDTVILLPAYSTLRDTLLGKTEFHCNRNGDLSLLALGGTAPWQYRLPNGNWQNDGVFEALQPGVYNIEIRDAEGCSHQSEIEIRDLRQQLELDIDSSHLMNSCNNALTFIALRASGSIPYYNYVFDDEPPVLNGFFLGLTTGTHRVFAFDEHGCHSDTLQFEVLNQTAPANLALQRALCPGEKFDWLGKTYTEPGIYNDTLRTVNGCDTIFVISIDVAPDADTSIEASICRGERFELNGKFYTDNGLYLDTLVSVLSGCDSILNLRLTVRDTFQIDRTFDICRGDTLFVDGILYDSAGVFVQVLPTYEGCDSTVTTRIRFLANGDCRARDCRLYVPNAFSPNGDNLNDELEIFSPVVQLDWLRVFDRWGNLVFEQNGSELRWDGRTASGRLAVPGIYVCLLRGICADGAEILVERNVAVIR